MCRRGQFACLRKRFDETLAIGLVLDPGEDRAFVIVDVIILVDVEGLRPVFVRPLSVFVGGRLNTVDAERKRNDHSVDGTKTTLGKADRRFHSERKVDNDNQHDSL